MPATLPFELVIFDCDGVLVDSEMLSADVLMTMMAEEQLPITMELFRLDFLGRSFANAVEKVEQRFGRGLPQDFQQRYRDRLLARMAVHLKAMPGVETVLANMITPYCLATGSSPQRLATSLSVSNLAGFFKGRCTTASEVARGKPAPDILFLAAQRCGVAPHKCLVIEDSEMGVRAAHAAGMAVWHFAGGAHVKAGYALPDSLAVDRRVADMAQLYHGFCEAGICSRPRVAIS